MAAAASTQPVLQPDEVLSKARAQREEDPHAATESLSRSLETLAVQLGSNVHPDLGLLWLEYGDLLLHLEEAAIGVPHVFGENVASGSADTAAGNAGESAGIAASSTGSEVESVLGQKLIALQNAKPDNACRLTGVDAVNSSTADAGDPAATAMAQNLGCLTDTASRCTAQAQGQAPADHAEDSSEDDDEDDLLLAYESLEVARMCLELKPDTLEVLQARARVHTRLADFEMLQDRPVEAVSQCRAALTLQQRAAADSQAGGPDAVCQLGKDKVPALDVHEALAHLLRASRRTRQSMDSLIEDEGVLQMLKDYIHEQKHGERGQAVVVADASIALSREDASGDGAARAIPAMEAPVRSRKRARDADHGEDVAH